MASTNGDSWPARAGRNQSLFRAINEELEGALPGEDGAGSLSIACECADVDCVEPIEIPRAEYLRIRWNPLHFAVLRDHVYPDVEIIVEEQADFVVVEKVGEASEVANAEA